MPTQNAIEVVEIAKTFQSTTALDQISFTVKPGEILGFLGPSGSGKTTTIKILTGQLLPTSGNAYVLGHSVQSYNEHRYEQIGIVAHQSGLYEKLSVYQNLHFFAKMFGVPATRIDELLERVGLSQHRKKPANKLSQGMRQRLVLARAILHQPQVLFLDEPTSGLDPSTTQAIHALIRELRDHGTAILLTTHDMVEATRLCSRVALLNAGRIAECAAPQALQLKYNRDMQYRVHITSEAHDLVLPASPETSYQINQWMLAGQLETIHSCEPTLEDVFLTVTGRSLK
ncbi:heme ABC exporter ATP-binding protein CcmA [Lactiplantibacillus paraplantarum]|uniref:Heme ABC exporter ATP-binding protein CcmA n=1 Tax=Lactiplantibacillus paraplantarum TaxID=60520 RepID=A0A4Q9Y465_9LACO|nr:heme ABC exporter ATP-binding protein CcmA [Lactiplantibacillus paraplantarum]TBX45853.1 heme ABC exporter ATP-binding protein CcmA [Lactiplantibacillus paraplantarum]